MEQGVELVGFIGGVFLAVCALPQVVHAAKGGSLEGMTWGFIVLWMVGELASLLYAVLALEANIWLVGNYAFNILAMCYLIKKKIAYKSKV